MLKTPFEAGLPEGYSRVEVVERK